VLFFERRQAFCPNLDIFINSATARKPGAARARRTARLALLLRLFPSRKRPSVWLNLYQFDINKKAKSNLWRHVVVMHSCDNSCQYNYK
jgi:hypothetical protein